MLNKLIAAILPLMPQSLVWIFSKRYIAGKTLEQAVDVALQLNLEGNLVTIDLLGEFITDMEQAKKNKEEYLNIIDSVEKTYVKGNYSLKSTMFGLLIDKEECYKNIREIVAKAASYNNFVRVDMEDSQCVDLEIELFRKLKKEFPKNVGLVLQAYLKRTFNDLTEMLDINTEQVPVNYRLCKGIYVEPKEIAYKKYEEINEHYLNDLEYMFKNKHLRCNSNSR